MTTFNKFVRSTFGLPPFYTTKYLKCVITTLKLVVITTFGHLGVPKSQYTEFLKGCYKFVKSRDIELYVLQEGGGV